MTEPNPSLNGQLVRDIQHSFPNPVPAGAEIYHETNGTVWHQIDDGPNWQNTRVISHVVDLMVLFRSGEPWRYRVVEQPEVGIDAAPVATNEWVGRDASTLSPDEWRALPLGTRIDYEPRTPAAPPRGRDLVHYILDRPGERFDWQRYVSGVASNRYSRTRFSTRSGTYRITRIGEEVLVPAPVLPEFQVGRRLSDIRQDQWNLLPIGTQVEFTENREIYYTHNQPGRWQRHYYGVAGETYGIDRFSEGQPVRFQISVLGNPGQYPATPFEGAPISGQLIHQAVNRLPNPMPAGAVLYTSEGVDDYSWSVEDQGWTRGEDGRTSIASTEEFVASNRNGGMWRIRLPDVAAATPSITSGDQPVDLNLLIGRSANQLSAQEWDALPVATVISFGYNRAGSWIEYVKVQPNQWSMTTRNSGSYTSLDPETYVQSRFDRDRYMIKEIPDHTYIHQDDHLAWLRKTWRLLVHYYVTAGYEGDNLVANLRDRGVPFVPYREGERVPSGLMNIPPTTVLLANRYRHIARGELYDGRARIDSGVRYPEGIVNVPMLKIHKLPDDYDQTQPVLQLSRSHYMQMICDHGRQLKRIKQWCGEYEVSEAKIFHPNTNIY